MGGGAPPRDVCKFEERCIMGGGAPPRGVSKFEERCIMGGGAPPRDACKFEERCIMGGGAWPLSPLTLLPAPPFHSPPEVPMPMHSRGNDKKLGRRLTCLASPVVATAHVEEDEIEKEVALTEQQEAEDVIDEDDFLIV